MLLRSVAFILRNLLLALVFANLEGQRLRLAVAQNAQLDLASRSSLAHRHLQLAAVPDLAAIQFAQHVAALQSRAARRRVRRYLADNRTRRIRQVEEVRVVRRHIVHADAEIPVMHRCRP